jgi:hypothetical protein
VLAPHRARVAELIAENIASSRRAGPCQRIGARHVVHGHHQFRDGPVRSLSKISSILPPSPPAEKAHRLLHAGPRPV